MSYECCTEGKIIVFKDEEKYHNARLYYLDYRKNVPEGEVPLLFYQILQNSPGNINLMDTYGVEEIRDDTSGEVSNIEANNGHSGLLYDLIYPYQLNYSDCNIFGATNGSTSWGIDTAGGTSWTISLNHDVEEVSQTSVFYPIEDDTPDITLGEWSVKQSFYSSESPEEKERKLKREKEREEKNKFNRFDIMDIEEEE